MFTETEMFGKKKSKKKKKAFNMDDFGDALDTPLGEEGGEEDKSGGCWGLMQRLLLGEQ